MHPVTATDPLQPAEAFQARVLEGRGFAERGDLAAAEGLFRRLLDESRDVHAGNHARALASLVTLYGRAGRYLEAHVLARRLAALATAVGLASDTTLAFALGKVCGALSQLRLTEPLGEALGELREVLDRLPARPANVEMEYHITAGTYASSVGDIPGARRQVEAYRATVTGVAVPEAVYRWALSMADARVALLEGRPGHARAELERLGGDVPSPPFSRLHELVLGVEVYQALGDGARARALADDALGLLASVQDEAFQAADFVYQGGRLTRALEAMGEVGLAARAYDLLAAAVLINLRQVDACMRELPELGLGDAASRAVLTGFRKQFLHEQHNLLERVARLLAPPRADAARYLLTGNAPEGWIAICAWCECVRTPDGAWLPIGHFIARHGALNVTHGICPACASALLPTRA